MSKKTTWMHIGIMRAWKIICLICSIILLLGTLGNLLLYFSPETIPVSAAYQDFISAYALYAAFLSGIATIVMFCCYRYTKGKLEEFETTQKKTSPDVMSELVSYGKKRNEILSKIASVTTLEEFDSLRAEVDSYNDDAEVFAESNGVTPKLISYSDYDSKRSKFE